MAKFKGYNCLTGACGGHKAGYKYGKNGGGTPSPFSPSFNEGLAIAQGLLKTPTQKVVGKAAKVAGGTAKGLLSSANVVNKGIAITGLAAASGVALSNRANKQNNNYKPPYDQKP